MRTWYMFHAHLMVTLTSPSIVSCSIDKFNYSSFVFIYLFLTHSWNIIDNKNKYIKSGQFCFMHNTATIIFINQSKWNEASSSKNIQLNTVGVEWEIFQKKRKPQVNIWMVSCNIISYLLAGDIIVAVIFYKCSL